MCLNDGEDLSACLLSLKKKKKQPQTTQQKP